jgi:hypothetical protein
VAIVVKEVSAMMVCLFEKNRHCNLRCNGIRDNVKWQVFSLCSLSEEKRVLVLEAVEVVVT